MKKVVIAKAGGHDRLRVEEHPDPTPGPGEVLVAVEAAGVNYADCIIRMGLYASANELVGWPITPGFEVAGTVAAVGSGVTGVTVGQRVMAVSLFGGYATRLVVPEHQVFAFPERLSIAEAAGMPAVYLTAWYALCELSRLRPGMKLLVHSAAGGVGGAILQIARIFGCQAIGVVRGAHKVESATALGASAVIDKGAQDLWAEAARHAPQGYDIVLDANGVETLGKSYQHTATGGRLIIYGFSTMMSRDADKPSYPKLAIDWLRTPRFNPLDLVNANKSIIAFNLSYLFPRKDLLADGMGALAEWLDAGKVVAPPVTTFPLERVADAHKAIESGKTVGKLVLTMPT